MAVVKNLMIRIGADYSAARQGMQGATRELTNFKRNTTRTVSDIRGRKGLGGIGTEMKSLGSTVTNSLSQISGAKGVGGVTRSLGSLKPILGSAVSGLRAFGAAAGGAGSVLGPLGIGLGALVAALALVTAGIAKASQPAVKFEADLGRLNMQLKGSSREFMNWARSMGLAKTTAAEMGATYGTLLSSFIRDNGELANQTKQIVQATRVVASATGRTIEDVTERMRSGLLGNTEAIEDLGIFVNVSMIESTKAFQKFANGKHWDQLDFRTQQQIRLQAILEQSYARYGDQLQNNVMTKQTLLMEQLKDIKLNLSQAFLPIWDAILPALNALAENVAYVTEQLARFSYWLRGWDYDERTKGLDQQTEAVQQQGDAYADLGSQAKSARKELAAFDQLNLLGDTSGGLGSGGGSAGGTGSGGTEGGLNNNSPWKGIPPAPPLLTKKWRIEFDPPNPPDAGIGGVATAVAKTVNQMIAETKAKMAQMWADLNTLTQAGVAGQLAGWGSLSVGLTAGIIPGMTTSAIQQWANMWMDMQGHTATSAPALQGQIATTLAAINQNVLTSTTNIRTNWRSMLSGMLADVIGYQPLISVEWKKINDTVSSIQNPLTLVKQAWHGALDYMQGQINAYRPYLEQVWSLIGKAIHNVESPLASLESSWETSLSNMLATARTKLGGILDKINGVIQGWAQLKSALTGASVSAPTVSMPNNSDSSASSSSPFSMGSLKSYLGNMFSKENFESIWGLIQSEASKPENQAAAAITGSIVAGGGAAAGAARIAPWLQKIMEGLKGLGGAIPAFATGAVVYGPTLAMVGDNAGARTNPEVIAPLSDLVDIMGGGDSGEAVAVLRQILGAIQSGRNVQVSISRNEVGQAAADYINTETRRGRNPLKNI